MNQIDAYDYDTLHRLTKIDYNNPGVTTGDEVYVYDSLGNRVTYTDQRNSITRTYANNEANEYTSVASYAVTHDAAGNLSKQVLNGSGDAYVYTYDCDNRLLQVDYDPNSGSNTTVATFAYDALGRKITARTVYDGTTDSITKDYRFYHDGQVEIADYESDNSTLARRFINGTQYLDERAVLIEGPAASADTFYYLLQELYTVTGLVEKSGALAEADVYDGYGKVRIWDYSRGDFDRDGDVDATDQTTFNAALLASGGSTKSTTDPSTDLDYDGDTDLADSGIFTSIKNSGGTVVDAFVSSIGNPFFFTGRRLYMLETLPDGAGTLANQQLQHNRARHYSLLDGRWLERDPAEQLDSSNLYEYVQSTPAAAHDPLGMWGAPIHRDETAWLLEWWCYMNPGAARMVGQADIDTDMDRWWGIGTGYLPFLGTQSRHFDRSSNGWDTRLRWKTFELADAKTSCNTTNDDPQRAVQHLGRALHSIQDWWAHGGYSAGPYDTMQIHSPEYDDPNYDANTSDARAPSMGGFSYAMLSWGPYSYTVITKETQYTDWVGGSRRLGGTRNDTVAVGKDFMSFIMSSAGKRCTCFFVGGAYITPGP
ncbi:MAG: hypothetical protein IT449_09825 [Phycisphaerales bacterium]|nr:hypothetical protein [Phycisphaerales bacterium]